MQRNQLREKRDMSTPWDSEYNIGDKNKNKVGKITDQDVLQA